MSITACWTLPEEENKIKQILLKEKHKMEHTWNAPSVHKLGRKSFIAEGRQFLVLSKTLLPKNKNIEMHISVDKNVWEINICSAELFEAKIFFMFFYFEKNPNFALTCIFKWNILIISWNYAVSETAFLFLIHFQKVWKLNKKTWP